MCIWGFRPAEAVTLSTYINTDKILYCFLLFNIVERDRPTLTYGPHTMY